jgi:hypothetical protein
MAALIGLLGSGPSVAYAQVAAADETILLVGVTRGPRSDSRLARTLEEHLRLTGETLTAGAHLTAAERLCGDGECLEQLAKREHAVLAITVNVRDSGPQSYFLTLALVDAQRRLPVQSEAVCDACSADELTTRLNDLSDKTLHLYRQRLQAGTRTAADPEHPQAVGGPAAGLRPTGRPGPFAQLTTQRKIIAGVLGAAALGVLIPSIFWSVKDGQPAAPPCSDDPLAAQDCRYDNKALYGTGYAITAALTGGLLLTLFLPGQAATTAPAAEKAP